jgi:hypothetical protein
VLVWYPDHFLLDISRVQYSHHRRQLKMLDRSDWDQRMAGAVADYCLDCGRVMTGVDEADGPLIKK